MREFKFRAWDECTRSMTYEVEFHKFSDGFGFRGLFKHFKSQWLYIPTKHVMQWTGLKDKNGKDIYEGYIIVSKYFDERIEEWVNRKGIIKFRKGYFYVEGIENKLWCPLIINIIRDSWNIKVIGNIFENPELLKEK